jgi:cytochrome c biogenesis protein CcmG/thiol:disulfide interchange protein DsbE
MTRAHRSIVPALAIWVAAWVVLSASAPAIGAGGRAPDVTLRTADGATAHLADFRGHVVLIDFWASWCPPCQESFPALDALYREYHARGLDVLAVNLDERRTDADAFLAAHPHAMPVLFDPQGRAPQVFDVRGMPTSVLIDRGGTVRSTHTGYSQKVLERYAQEIPLLLSER